MSKPHFVLENCLANFDDISLLLVFHVLGVENLCNCEMLKTKKEKKWEHFHLFLHLSSTHRESSKAPLICFYDSEKEIIKSNLSQ